MEKGTAAKSFKCVELGAAVSLAVYLLLLTLAAYLTANGRIGEGLTERVSLLCAVLAAFTGTLVGKKKGGKQLLPPVLGAVAFAGTVLLLGVVLLDVLSLRRALVFLAAVAAGAALALLFSKSGGKRGKRRKSQHSRR